MPRVTFATYDLNDDGQSKRLPHGQSKVIYPQGRGSSTWDHSTAMEYMDKALRATRSRAAVTRPRRTDRLMSKSGRSRFEGQSHTAVGRVLTRALNDMTKAGIITTTPSYDDLVDLILSWVPTWLDYVGEPEEPRGMSLLPYRWLEATAREHSDWVVNGGWERQWVLDRAAMGRRGGKASSRGATYTVDMVDALQPSTYKDVMDGLGCKSPTTAKALLKKWRDQQGTHSVSTPDRGQSKRAQQSEMSLTSTISEPHFKLDFGTINAFLSDQQKDEATADWLSFVDDLVH